MIAKMTPNAMMNLVLIFMMSLLLLLQPGAMSKTVEPPHYLFPVLYAFKLRRKQKTPHCHAGNPH
jgi:hypothetical protein